MFLRISLFITFFFWATMTYLLWRSEYVSHNQVGSSVPEELVWKKILSAPDNSSLQIMHHGKKVGACTWASNVGQDLVEKITTDTETTPEGMLKGEPNYRLVLEGNVLWDEGPKRMKFGMELKMNTNNAWQEFDLRFNIRPTSWELHSRAVDENVHFTTETHQNKTEQVFKFSDFQNPQSLLQDLNGPGAMALLGALGSMPPPKSDSKLSIGLNWRARNDWVSIGHTSVRAYRLEAAVLDRYRMLIIVSRVGEILRVQLPDEWELINDQLTTL